MTRKYLKEIEMSEISLAEQRHINGGILALLPLVAPTVGVFSLGIYLGEKLYHELN